MLHNRGVLRGMLVIVCGSVYCGRPQHGAQLVVSPNLKQNNKFYDFCIPLFNFRVSVRIEIHSCQGSRWISCIMTRAAAWWTCLQRGSLLNTLNTNDNWLSQFKVLYHPLESYTAPSSCFCIHRLLFLLALQHTWHVCWMKWSKDVSDLLSPLPRCLLSSLIPYAFTFPHRKWFTVKHIPTANPNSTHWSIPTDPVILFLPPLVFCHGGTSWLQPVFFFPASISSSEHLWSAPNHVQ